MHVTFVDSSIIIVNKPAGLATIPGGWEKDSLSLVELLQADYGRIWVVHRLDKITSGLVVFARNSDAHRTLSMLFEHRQTHKVYHAIAVGIPAWDVHIARHPLHINVGHSHRTVIDHGRGKPSETTFHVLQRFRGCTLLEAIPATGRTHQVRVHAFALGFPLLGDTLYDAPPTNLILRPALHAVTLSFPHPVTGEQMMFSAPYPPDFENALQFLRSNQ